MAGYEPPSLRWNGIMIVGEAPGAEEIRLGRPFVGRSGQLLDKALAEAGVARAASYVANVFPWQPPGNKVDHFYLSRKAAQVADVALSEAWGQLGGKFCAARFIAGPENLRKTVLAERPRVVLAVGRTPLWALTGLNGITQEAGKTIACRWDLHIPVVVTYHPSYILRGNWKLMPTWIAHMRATVVTQGAA